MTNQPIPDPLQSMRLAQPADVRATRPVRGSEHTADAREAREARASTPAFEALLDRLEQRAQRLRDREGEVNDPAGLSGAVDDARASLEDALSLGDRLLEAYRQASRNQPSPIELRQQAETPHEEDR